ncbi:MAG: hypothetical protein QOI63_133 [Thermoplasmata archaeon]|jgi:hypothetical protein|nr:hypothetical protein [Thermoplasmata archaeon]
MTNRALPWLVLATALLPLAALNAAADGTTPRVGVAIPAQIQLHVTTAANGNGYLYNFVGPAGWSCTPHGPSGGLFGLSCNPPAPSTSDVYWLCSKPTVHLTALATAGNTLSAASTCGNVVEPVQATCQTTGLAGVFHVCSGESLGTSTRFPFKCDVNYGTAVIVQLTVVCGLAGGDASAGQ